MPAPRRAPLTCALVLAAALSAGLGPGCARPPVGAQLGEALPPLPTTAGPASPWAGGPAVIVVWSSDCRPCRSLAAEASAAPLPAEISLLHVNLSDGADLAQRQARALGLPGAPVQGPTAALLDALALDALPLVLVLDADGVVRARGAVWADARAAAARIAAG
jgi:hypothetical protein